jgi:methyl-accepting chemotaxis protein
MAHKRSLILINKPFQLRFAFYVCSWLFVLSLFYPLSIEALLNSFLDYVRLDPKGPELDKIEAVRQDLTQLVMMLQAGFLGVTFIVSVYLSHRIAGPWFKLRKFLDEASQGKTHQRLRFRKSDHFQELADSYNQMMDTLGGTLVRTSNQVTGAIQNLESAIQKPGAPREDLEKTLQILREVQRQTSFTDLK